MAAVQIRATHLIKPAEKTWTGTMKLSEFDMTMAKGFVPKLYLYRPNKEWDAASISQILRESLGKVLVHFYPFLGRMRQLDGGRLELVVHDQDEATWGVPLVEAETALEVADLGDFAEAQEKGRFQDLFSMADYSKPIQELPLLMVKLTHFRCGGVAVAITWSHAVVDGVGAGHFYTEWTRLARGEPLGMAPIHDRALLRAGEPPRSAPQLIQKGAAPPPPPTPVLPPPTLDDDLGVDGSSPPIAAFLQTATVKLPVSQSQISHLKQLAADEAINGRPYSHFEVLTAHAWRCASKARGHEGHKLNAIGIAVDFRKRVNPPLPQEFNGNAVLILTATSESGDLNSSPLRYGCERIRQTVQKVTDELVWANLDYQKSLEDLGAWRGVMTPEGLFVNPDVMMVSWMNLAFNDLDFGWGNEAYMGSTPQSWEGVACLSAGHEAGSANVVMCLQVAHVDKFKEYFFQDLK